MSNKKAFTIIEVVLVLAVAGLIFLVVFAAVPRLQASRRDNQRKRDLESIFSLSIEYSSNTGNAPLQADVDTAFAGTTSSPFHPYIENAGLIDPSGVDYNEVNAAMASLQPGQFRFLNSFECNGAGDGFIAITPTNNSQYGIAMKLERGVYCLDTQ